MKRMLINATEQEETRVAIVEGQQLFDLDIELPSRQQKKSNIYKGKITRVEPSLEAAFIDYGADRHGFLPLKEISRLYFSQSAQSAPGRANIKEAVFEGQELVVQVEKEERGNKGAALTTFISLPGRYLVLMPNNPRAGGVSRRIEGDDRTEIREAMAALDIPKGMGLIVRTAGVGRSTEELQWDLDYLIQLWQSINASSQDRKSPFLIYQESNVIIRAIRDYLRSDIGEILVDNADVYQEAYDFMQKVMPQYLKKIKHYEDDVPLFTRFQIEVQIESAFTREVSLPSGGAIVIDHTEALTAIDINSAKATKGSDIEETARNTNLEAAVEIGRQLRLRDLGGLLVIDFIDMLQNRNQRDVENRLREAVKLDRARVQIGRISRFGLMEMSRQRLRPSLGESTHHLCPRCEGQGVIRSIESLALSILRIIEEESMKENTVKIITQVPVNIATFLINEKRQTLTQIESRQKVSIDVIPNLNMDSPNYDIQRIRSSEDQYNNKQPSYDLIEKRDELALEERMQKQASVEAPAVKNVPQKPTPRKESGGLIKKFVTSLFRKNDDVTSESETPNPPVQQPQPQATQQNRDQNRDQNRNRGNRNQNRGHQNRDNRNTQHRSSQNRHQNRDHQQHQEQEQTDESCAKPELQTQNKVQSSETPNEETQNQSSKYTRRPQNKTNKLRRDRGRGRRDRQKTAVENPELVETSAVTTPASEQVQAEFQVKETTAVVTPTTDIAETPKAVEPVVAEAGIETPEPVVAEAAMETPEPVVAEAETETPEPVVAEAETETPEPVVAEAETQTPEPVVAEAATETPEPVVAEAATETPEPVVAEAETETPEPVVAEAETETPEPVVAEAETETPEPVVAEAEAETPEPVAAEVETATLEPVVAEAETETPESAEAETETSKPRSSTKKRGRPKGSKNKKPITTKVSTTAKAKSSKAENVE